MAGGFLIKTTITPQIVTQSITKNQMNKLFR
jgi:hypothetical protein